MGGCGHTKAVVWKLETGGYRFWLVTALAPRIGKMLSMVALSLGRQKQVGIFEFKASLIYLVSFRTASTPYETSK